MVRSKTETIIEDPDPPALKAVFRIRIHWVQIRIRHFRLNTDPDSESGSNDLTEFESNPNPNPDPNPDPKHCLKTLDPRIQKHNNTATLPRWRHWPGVALPVDEDRGEDEEDDGNNGNCYGEDEKQSPAIIRLCKKCLNK